MRIDLEFPYSEYGDYLGVIYGIQEVYISTSGLHWSLMI